MNIVLIIVGIIFAVCWLWYNIQEFCNVYHEGLSEWAWDVGGWGHSVTILRIQRVLYCIFTLPGAFIASLVRFITFKWLF